MSRPPERPAGEIAVPDRPVLEGLRFRGYRGPIDLPGMTAVNQAARAAYGIEDPVTLEGMINQYAHLSNSDVARDLVVVELGGEIVGYARIEWADQHDGSRAYEHVGLLRPELRGRGIGRAMLTWLEARARQIAAEHGPGERWLQAELWDADEYAARLVRRFGYTEVRRLYEMLRSTLDDLPLAPLPAGIEVRPVARADLRAIWEADVEIFRDHWGRQEDDEASWLRYRDDPAHDPALYVVAFDGPHIAGQVLNVVDRAANEQRGVQRGLIDAVGVRRAYRRRGLARALIARSLAVLRDRGMTSAFLGVDAENPHQALRLYEECGFHVASSATIWRKQMDAAPRREAPAG